MGHSATWLSMSFFLRKRRLGDIFSRTFIQSWILQESSSLEIQQGRKSSLCYNSRQWIQDTCKCLLIVQLPIEPPSFEALRSPIELSTAKVSASPAITNDSPVNRKVDRSSPVRPSPIINGVDPNGRSMEKPRTMEDVSDRTKPWQLSEIVDAVQCLLVTMPEGTDSSKVIQLLYANSGIGVLALGSNGVQKLWQWARNEQNPSGKATANVVPQHWQPNSGLLMANDVSGVNLEESVMTTFMPALPASTFLEFHPQDNNIIAIGMEDSTIHTYNVRVDKVKSKLKGHQKRIIGLAFSMNLNILVSSGADAQPYSMGFAICGKTFLMCGGFCFLPWSWNLAQNYIGCASPHHT
ncbi:hypothetical protein CMV_016582 [Castanea mollissima]|uniref:Uncharacterized protein n=1 Tax=Castanea mollissima TaxID=60419 RepID=A0A8J4VRJ9_9ROSI|nr:hypothetical protein CMV_016582 [Castanea mollissima]